MKNYYHFPNLVECFHDMKADQTEWFVLPIL